MISIVIVILFSYLVGAIPFSYIAGKLVAGIDIREHGSGNVGASNTYRILGPKVAFFVLLGDVAKGFFPVIFAPAFDWQQAISPHWLMLAAALFSVLGHTYSIYLRFEGGKGIATSAGAFLALTPWAFLTAFGVWIILLAITRVVSIASLAAAVALPISVFVLGRLHIAYSHWSIFALSIAVSVVVIIRHKSNIQRLITGKEPALVRKKR